MQNKTQNKLKILTIFAGCLLFRLLPLRAPNVEPIMASLMPLSRKYGAFFSFAFGFSSIFLYDMLTSYGSWTWVVGITYGLTGVASFLYFKNKKGSSIWDFAKFAFVATIVFDLVTGVLMAPFLGQNIWNAFLLQITFTALHLAGNIGFALTLSPLLNKWLASKEFFSLVNGSELKYSFEK